MTPDASGYWQAEARSRHGEWWRPAAQARWAMAVVWIAFSVWTGAKVHAGTPDSSAACKAQNWLIKNWTTDDGLPGSDVTAIVQTSDGYLWLGTFDGLVRFDGLKFTVLDRSNTPDLPSNAVVNLHLDRQGVLWISTDRGLVTLKEGHWRTYGANEGWTGNYIRTFAEGAGQLFVTDFGGKVFQFRDDRWVQLPAPPGQQGRGYLGHVDDRGRLWVIQFRYFGYWDGDRWSKSVENPVADGEEIMAGPSRDGALWVWHFGHLDKYRSGQRVKRLDGPQSLPNLWSLYEDREGSVWLASYNRGLARLLPDGSVERFTTTNGLSSLSIRCVFEDNEGDHWVGAAGGGLMRLKNRPVLAFGEEAGVPRGSVRSVAAGKAGQIYIGTYGGGVASIDPRASAGTPAFQLLSEGGLVDSVLADRSGRVWVAKAGIGLLCFDGQQVTTNDVLSPPEKATLALFEDSHGRIWLSDHMQISVLEEGKWRVLNPEPGFTMEAVRAFSENRRMGVIYMGAYNGDLYHSTGDVIRRVAPSGDALKTAIIALFTDDDGTLWLGSVGSGLGRLRHDRLAWIDRAHGLPATSIGSVLDDGLGSLWLGARQGIVRVDRAELNAVADGRQSRIRFRVFDAGDGMPVTECSDATQPNAAKDGLGLLWFATRKGLAVMRPQPWSADAIPPPVHIEAVDFVVPDGKTRHLEQPLPAKLVLPAGTKRLQIHYSGLSLSSPEKVIFRQRVEGLDQDWVEVGTERSATFQEVAPGTFKFWVTAANAEGIWNEGGASLAYTVLPLFWQTRLFRGLIGLLVVTEGALIVALLAYHWRSSYLRNQLRDNQERWDLASVAAKLGLWTWDIAADRFWATDNAYALLGHPASAPIAFKDLADFQNPDDRAPARRALEQALGGNHDYDTEFRVMLPDGEPRWLAARGLVDFDRHGKPLRLRGVWIDLSARKQLEIEAARHQMELAHMGRVAVLGELSGSLAHEVNQPLAAILSNAQAAQRFLEQNPPNTSELHEILSDIVADDRRAGEVIRRIRSMLKKGTPEFQALHMNKLIQQVLMLARSDLVARNVSVVTELEPDMPLVQGDPVQIQQVLLNLMVNACDAMEATTERELRIRAERAAADQLRISVVDRGMGVSGAMLEHIFEPFVTTKKNGLGMGLALCRSIITAHGGRIWAAKNEGQGLTVSFTLRSNLEVTKPNA
jgi:signal transduction histidine kinase/ligand-binding sensor domain-containing protein